MATASPVDILSSVIDHINVLHQIKWSVAKVSQNNGRYDAILQRILDALLIVQDLCERRPEYIEQEALRLTLRTFHSNMEKLRRKCDDALKVKGRSGFRRVVSGQWQTADIIGPLEQLELDIAPSYGKYQEIAEKVRESAVSGIRADVVAGTREIKGRFEQHIQYATSKPERIQTFVRTKRMSVNEKTRAKDLALESLDTNRLSEIEWKYYSLKVELLNAELPDGGSAISSGSEDSTSTGASSSSSTGGDAVMEIFQVLRGFEKLESNEPLSDIALRLGHLHALLADLRMRDDAVKVLELQVAVHRELGKENDAPSPELASALQQLGTQLMETDRSSEAPQYFNEALIIRRQLTISEPAIYGIPLVESLRGLSQWYAAEGKYHDALLRATEVHDIVELLSKEDPLGTLFERGRAAHDLSERLAAAGQRDAALDRIREAVEVRRSLTKNGDDDKRLAELAHSLSSQSARMSDVGQWDEALEPIVEAVHINNTLVQRHPANDTYKMEWAGSLARMSGCMAILGRNGEALHHIQKVVEIQRQMSLDDPAFGRTLLAVSLQHQGRRLEEIGEHYGAIRSIQEAMDIWREAVVKQPSALWLSELASCLGDLSTCLRTVGQLEPASKYVLEAVRIRQRLADDNPEAFLSSLATSFDQLSSCMAELDQMDDAVKYAHLAVSVLRRLDREHPNSIFLSDLAFFLSNLSTCLDKAGQRDQSLSYIQEAVDIWRKLGVESPKTYLPDLARGLEDLALRSMVAGRRQTALRSIQDAISIFQQLVVDKADMFRPCLASALRVLAKWYVEDGRLSEGRMQIRESVAIFRALADQQPDMYLVDLVISTNALVQYSIEAKQNKEALQAMKDSIEALRRLAAKRCDDFQPDLAVSLRNLAGFLAKRKSYAEALTAAQESVQIYRALLSRRPGIVKHQEGLQESIRRLSTCQTAMELSGDGSGKAEPQRIRRATLKT